MKRLGFYLAWVVVIGSCLFMPSADLPTASAASATYKQQDNSAATIQQLRQDVGNLQREVRNLQAENKTLKDKLAKAEKDRDAAKATSKAFPTSQPQQSIDDLIKQNQALSQQVQALRATVDNFRKENARLKGLTKQSTSQPTSQPTSRPTNQPTSLPAL
jgi:predicted RNase H-like nuclease (RuvC/YqgF family)